MAAASSFSDLAGLRMSAEEFFALGETRERYELIDGVVQMSPSPTPRHQMMVFELALELGAARRLLPGLLCLPDIDLQLSPTLVYQPDFVIYGPGRLRTVPAICTVPPELVVEVLSPGTRSKDLITKRADYERFGIAEYWVFDPADGSARCWRRLGGAYGEVKVEGDRLACAAISGLSVDLRQIRAAAGFP